MLFRKTKKQTQRRYLINRIIYKLKRKIVIEKSVASYATKHHLPYFQLKKRISKLRKQHHVIVSELLLLDYMLNEQNAEKQFMLHNEYINKSLKLNRLESLDVLRDKSILFQRCSAFLGRACLDASSADLPTIDAFIRNNERFVGKVNYGLKGSTLCIYDTRKLSVKRIYKKIKRNGHTILEAYIVQHDILSSVYPGSINTLRIHTVNGADGVRVFLPPKVRFGCGKSIIDIGEEEGSYKAFVAEDGSLSHAVYVDKYGRMQKTMMHQDTKIEFNTIRLPYIKEALNMVLRVAKAFPELAYIGWDVALTSSGPVIVEGNSISGALRNYQQMVYLYEGKGLKEEIDEIFTYGATARSVRSN